MLTKQEILIAADRAEAYPAGVHYEAWGCTTGAWHDTKLEDG